MMLFAFLAVLPSVSRAFSNEACTAAGFACSQANPTLGAAASACTDITNALDPMHACDAATKTAMIECSHQDAACLAEYQANMAEAQAAQQNSAGGSGGTPAPVTPENSGGSGGTPENSGGSGGTPENSGGSGGTPAVANPCAQYTGTCLGAIQAANPDHQNVVGAISTGQAPVSWGMIAVKCQADSDPACKAFLEAQGGYRKLSLHCEASLTEEACGTELGVLTNIQAIPDDVTDDLVTCGVTNAVETEDEACLTAYDEVRAAEPDYLADEAAGIETLRDQKAAEKAEKEAAEKEAADKAAADDDSSSATLLVGSLLSILPVFYALW